MLLFFFKFRYSTLQTCKAFFYILVIVIGSNISTLHSLESLLVSSFSIASLIGTLQYNIIVIRASQGIRIHISIHPIQNLLTIEHR
jgi:hypothetical protein